MKGSLVLPVLLWTAIGMAYPAAAQDRRDLRLADGAVSTVQQYVHFTIFDDVNISVDQGVVTLSGKVTMPYKRDDLEKRIAKIDGVRQVVNDIGVLPVSIMDERLRASIARAIYRNPSFWQYASMVNPPIHIIVERGRVTLTGVVASNVDRMLAQSLATGRGELGVVNQLRTE